MSDNVIRQQLKGMDLIKAKASIIMVVVFILAATAIMLCL